MPREVKPCGTEAAYRRHLYHQEDPCPACTNAHREYTAHVRRNKELTGKVAQVAAHSSPMHTLNDPLRDRIRRLEENLAIVDAALSEAIPKEVPALSKRRQELEEAIWKLTPDQQQEGNALDELAKRRAQRTAAATA